MSSPSSDCLNTQKVVINRIIAAGGCFLASLTALLTILVLHRRKAWETQPKRLFLIYIVFTAVSALVALPGIDYSQFDSQRSFGGSDYSNDTALVTGCLGLALALHYSEGLASMSYAAWALSFLVHVTLPVIESSPSSRYICYGPLLVMGKKKNTRIFLEAVLFTVVIIVPAIVTSWEPFALSDTPDYGSNGLWCDYRHNLVLNCSAETQYYNIGTFYLSVVPYISTSVFCWILEALVVILLCGLWIKFKNIVGKRILTSLPSVIFLLVGESVILLWLFAFLSATVLAKFKQSPKSEFLWVLHATLPLLSNAITVLIVSTFLYYPFRKCCKRVSKSTELNSHIPRNNYEALLNSDGNGSNPASESNIHCGMSSGTTAYHPPNEMSDYLSEEDSVLISRDHRCAHYGINW